MPALLFHTIDKLYVARRLREAHQLVADEFEVSGTSGLWRLAGFPLGEGAKALQCVRFETLLKRLRLKVSRVTRPRHLLAQSRRDR